MRATFRPDAAKGVYETYEMHVGDEVFHMVVADGTLQAGTGPADAPDFVFSSDLATFMAIGAGQLSAMDAVMKGLADVKGEVEAALRCPAIFGFGPDGLQDWRGAPPISFSGCGVQPPGRLMITR